MQVLQAKDFTRILLHRLFQVNQGLNHKEQVEAGLSKQKMSSTITFKMKNTTS
jgi:hypothetical protein